MCKMYRLRILVVHLDILFASSIVLGRGFSMSFESFVPLALLFFASYLFRYAFSFPLFAELFFS